MACTTARPGRIHRQAKQHLPHATCQEVERLRRERYTQDQIAAETGLSRATVSRILKRLGLSLLACLEPKPERPRYERETPGEIIHIDIKKLGRFNKPGHRVTGDRTRQSNQRDNGTAPGWEYVHVAIDDHSRIAYSDIFPNERKGSAVAHLKTAVTYYRSLGITVTRVMTDNGSCYKSHLFRDTCKALHTSPPRPLPTPNKPI